MNDLQIRGDYSVNIGQILTLEMLPVLCRPVWLLGKSHVIFFLVKKKKKKRKEKINTFARSLVLKACQFA